MAILGCGEDPAAPVTSGEPVSISVVWGNDQPAKAGEELESALWVVVKDANGLPVQGVTVEWDVRTGAGLFPIRPSGPEDVPEFLQTRSTRTGPYGGTGVRFIPTALGRTVVTATASTESAGTIGSVTFGATADTLVINLWGLGWSASWPLGPQDLTVPLRTPIEWANRPPAWTQDDPWTWGWYMFSAAVVRSTRTPPGAAPFQSDVLNAGRRFSFIPEAAGEWGWELVEVRGGNWDWGDLVARDAPRYQAMITVE